MIDEAAVAAPSQAINRLQSQQQEKMIYVNGLKSNYMYETFFTCSSREWFKVTN